jgi:hypothetical protein
VQYTRRVKRDGKFAVRFLFYSERRKTWRTIADPVALPADAGTLSLETKDGLNTVAGPLVIFVELIEGNEKPARIVSNTVAGVVTID